ncbi:hypothetical protein FRC09_015763 [Ceratobasidium sp. 395]|nr:hypothetical protein FRC09_015763 [Ceratobasidium sp. 395]
MTLPGIARNATLAASTTLPPYPDDKDRVRFQVSVFRNLYADARIVTTGQGTAKAQASGAQSAGPEDDFKDPYGPRLGRSARFWKVYVQEANLSDDELLTGWNQLSLLRPGYCQVL